jgi:hypothetical protein
MSIKIIAFIKNFGFITLSPEFYTHLAMSIKKSAISINAGEAG